MPVISRFYGIVIKMYFSDHQPPHFHAEYGGEQALVEILTSKLVKGKLPERQWQLVRKWAELHRTELLENWNAAIANDVLKPIKALDE